MHGTRGFGGQLLHDFFAAHSCDVWFYLRVAVAGVIARMIICRVKVMASLVLCAPACSFFT